MPKLLPPVSFALLPRMGMWLVLASVVAALAGTASAFFLFALDHATTWRDAHRGVVWLLPFAGLAVGMLYRQVGQSVDGGLNLILDEIHTPKKVVPLRMVPLVLASTVVSHRFGASVGREGTAVQMGAALADQLTAVFRLAPHNRRILLMTGLSAGFASVFGTPLAGAVFGLEVPAMGRMRYDALFACVVAAILADQVGLAWGIHHTHYAVLDVVPVGWWSVLAVAIAGVLFGLVGMLFAKTTRAFGAFMKHRVPSAPLRPFIGGIAIATAVWGLDAYRYIGLGTPDILEAFHSPVRPWDFLGKLLFTATSVGRGFKGGEVTPLFYIGATLRNALVPLLHMPLAMMAGLGFVAVFAGAANTPITTILMALELFGPQIGPFAAIACVSAYLCSGHAGIYQAQRIGRSKHRLHREAGQP
ncbi:voltage-gated chloride channel family protein [Comamonas terrigena]|uniref:voltage-gated chloride channel family protein n=1 Tax=Comamonas terrigena TaxID=32013 RepID=UPI0028A85E58|nr:voltage-gated chloride channel family protein [Comamonas terrigena]